MTLHDYRQHDPLDLGCEHDRCRRCGEDTPPGMGAVPWCPVCEPGACAEDDKLSERDREAAE
jgi:hypothetical protein